MQKRSSDDILVSMYNDLKRYAHSPKANPSAVKAKEMFIAEIQEVFSEKDNWINQLESDIERVFKELTKMKNIIIKLEAICLIHGIDDLAAWMAKDTGALVDDVRFNQKFNLTQIPDRLLENEAWRNFYNEQMQKLQHKKN